MVGNSYRLETLQYDIEYPLIHSWRFVDVLVVVPQME